MDIYKLLRTFPSFVKPSYETAIHKKGIPVYDIGVAIPYGKRAFLWCTNFNNKDIVCIVEYGRNQKLQDNVHFISLQVPKEFYFGTIVSGYLLDDEELYHNQKIFLGDDIFMFKGYEFGNPFPTTIQKKMIPFIDFFRELPNNMSFPYSIHSIAMWEIDHENNHLPFQLKNEIGYVIKCTQYRCSKKVLPHLNRTTSEFQSMSTGEDIHPNNVTNIWSKATSSLPIWNLKLNSLVYKRNCLFWVKADITFDVYYLYASSNVLYQCALIPDHKTSVYMNSLFRNIPENDCLDKVEESDSEDEFENIQDTKYLKNDTFILMECRFHRKFRKWIPMQHKMNENYLGKYVPIIEDLVYSDNDVIPNQNSHKNYNRNHNNHHHKNYNNNNNNNYNYNNRNKRYNNNKI